MAGRIREPAAVGCEASRVPGYLAGVYRDGEQTIMAHRVANVSTGAPMVEDPGFLLGSITKVMTATLVHQQVERGVIDINEPIVRYLPEFKLAASSSTEQICVHHLLNHTNGIDADRFFPDAAGRGALQVFVEGIGQHCGTLFAPGEYISHSNGGMIVTGRLLEVTTGTPSGWTVNEERRATMLGSFGGQGPRGTQRTVPLPSIGSASARIGGLRRPGRAGWWTAWIPSFSPCLSTRVIGRPSNSTGRRSMVAGATGGCAPAATTSGR